MQHSLQKLAMAAFGPSCLMRRFMSTVFWKTLWIQRSVGTVYVRNVTGQHALLQLKHYSIMMPPSRSSKMACGTWSSARNRVILRCPRKYFNKNVDQRTITGRMRRMTTMTTGAKMTSPMRTTDATAAWQKRIRYLSFIHLTGLLSTKLASVLDLWKYAGLHLFWML